MAKWIGRCWGRRSKRASVKPLRRRLRSPSLQVPAARQNRAIPHSVAAPSRAAPAAPASPAAPFDALRFGDPAPVSPSTREFVSDMVASLLRKSNADDDSKQMMVRTALSRIQAFVCFIVGEKTGLPVTEVKRIYEPLLWASTRPDLLELFVDKELVKARGLSSSTILNTLNDLKKAVTWAVNHHRKTCGSPVP